MASLIENVQDRFKTGSNAIGLMSFKFVSGFFLGLTLALIADEIIRYGILSFVLVMAISIGSFMRIARSWSWTNVFVFDLICILIGLLLRMYILIAPGA